MNEPVAGSSIRWTETGEGRPIVILHRLTLDHRYAEASLEPVFEGRQNHWRRIYPDLPGHGVSPGEKWIRNNDDMVEAVVRFIDSQLPDKRFSLAGLSYGGYLARGVAHRLAGRLDGLLLWVPACYPHAERQVPPPSVIMKDPTLISGVSSESERGSVGLMVVQSQEALSAIRTLVAPAEALIDEKFLDRVTDTKLSFNPEDPPFLRPALIVCGRQDHVAGYRDSWEFLEGYPRAAFAVLDGAGHLLGFTEQLRLFRGLVGDWLDRIERTA
jgi:pimeloyl-ACP methyl ester carboxylesterase